MGKVIGIDLGTTNSCVAVLGENGPVIIPNSEGNRTTPSVVAFTSSGERLAGEAAKRQAAVNTENTIYSIKRQMGNDYRVNINGKKYSPQEISAIILQKLKKDAESYLGESVSDAVITVPAYFNDAQRQATRDAGRIAGLNVRRIINEPASAALAYGLDHGENQKILVYDLGGGTFDVSVIEIGDNLVEVLATSGDNHLGGDDFDGRITEYLIKEFKKTEKARIEKDAVAVQRIREAAEKAKRELSQLSQANVTLPFLWNGKGGAKHMDITVTRDVFDSITEDLVERTRQPVLDALSQAGITAESLDKVILAGGATRIPAIQAMVKRITGKEPCKNLNPDECVAAGACIQGGRFSGEMVAGTANDIILLDVTPLSLSIETIGGVATKLIERNTPIPTRQSQIFTTAGNFQTSVDIKVLQGERKFAKDNKLLGNFRLTGIKRAFAGVPQIEVSFDIDANGIVNVSAKDLGTGRQQQITITSSSNLTEEEIRRAEMDARMYASEEAARKEAAAIRNDAEAYLYKVEQVYHDKGKQLERSIRMGLKSDMSELRRRITKTKPEKITPEQAWEILQAMEKLRQTVNSASIGI